MMLRKIGLLAFNATMVLSLSTIMAEAKGLSAGHYRLQEGAATATFCLRANGTFFITSSGDLIGRWANRTLNGTVTGFMWGNFDSGDGNTSIVALGVANSKVTEWSDTNTFAPLLLNAARITKLSNACPVVSPGIKRSGGLVRR